MKRFTTVLLAALAIAATANADEPTFTYQWAHVVDAYTSAGDNVIAAVPDGTGSVYVATSFGTTTSTPYVTFDTDTILGADGYFIQGGNYSGSSNNGNMLLQKVNIESGEVEWFAYTKKGDVDQSATAMALTPDSGLVVVVKTRAWVKTDGYDNLLEYVAPDGFGTTIKDLWTTSSEYRYLILKISKDGELETTSLIAGKPTINGYTASNQIYIYGVVVDDSGNIYVGGNFRTEMYFKNSSGDTVTYTAYNNDGWDGDSQDSLGDLFIAKFDSDGYFTSAIVADNTAEYASYACIDRLAYNDGYIYFDARIKGIDSATTSLGGISISASTSVQTMVVGAITTDMTVSYAKAVQPLLNKSSSYTLQNKNAQYLGGKVYYTGLVNGGFSDDSGNALTDGSSLSMLKGYVLEVEPSTGAVSNAYVWSSSSTISGFFGVFLTDNYVICHGYNMKTTEGGVLVTLNKTDFSLSSYITVCTSGTVALCGQPAVYGDYFVMMNRGKTSSTFYGTDTTFTGLSAWLANYYCYKIEESSSTGVSALDEDEDLTGNYDVYTPGGILLKKADNLNDAKDGLDKGIYIIGNQKVAITK